MQPLSPRQYFETRLRQLPIFKCLVNENWQESKMANVAVLRRHVNGKISGSVFLVDLLCLGVKDMIWFFNEDADEMVERLENYSVTFEEIPYQLAHNIVFAGHDFAAENEIKPHTEFAIARFALEEDDDNIPLMDIETGLDGMPHLMERYPGQYTDALLKLKKHAGEGNYHHTVVFNSKHEADEHEAGLDDDDIDEEDDWEEEEEDEGDWDKKESTESDWDDLEDDDDEESEFLLSEAKPGELTIYNVSFLSDEDLYNTELINERTQEEQINISIERHIRACEKNINELVALEGNDKNDDTDKLAAEEILLLTEEDLVWSVGYPNGCEPEPYQNAFDLINGILKKTFDEEESEIYWERILETAQKGNIILLAHCLLMLLSIKEGPDQYKKLAPAINQNSKYPMVALAQSILVIAKPNEFTDEPVIKNASPILKEAIPHFKAFSDEEYCLFYALRCLQAANQKQTFQTIAWYRQLADSNEADLFPDMLIALQTKIIEICSNYLDAAKLKS